MIPGAEAEGDKVEDGGEDGTKNCGGCGKPVFGRAVEARDQVYHPDHFVCWNCSQPFVSSYFYLSTLVCCLILIEAFVVSFLVVS